MKLKLSVLCVTTALALTGCNNENYISVPDKEITPTPTPTPTPNPEPTPTPDPDVKPEPTPDPKPDPEPTPEPVIKNEILIPSAFHIDEHEQSFLGYVVSADKNTEIKIKGKKGAQVKLKVNDNEIGEYVFSDKNEVNVNVTALNGINTINASISKGDNYSIELNQTFHHLDSILEVQTFNFSYGYKLIGIDLQMNQLTGTKLSGDFFKEITVEKPKRYFKLELNDDFKLPINDEVLLKEVTITYPNGFSSTGTIQFKNKHNQTYIDFWAKGNNDPIITIQEDPNAPGDLNASYFGVPLNPKNESTSNKRDTTPTFWRWIVDTNQDGVFDAKSDRTEDNTDSIKLTKEEANAGVKLLVAPDLGTQTFVSAPNGNHRKPAYDQWQKNTFNEDKLINAEEHIYKSGKISDIKCTKASDHPEMKPACIALNTNGDLFLFNNETKNTSEHVAFSSRLKVKADYLGHSPDATTADFTVLPTKFTTEGSTGIHGISDKKYPRLLLSNINSANFQDHKFQFTYTSEFPNKNSLTGAFENLKTKPETTDDNSKAMDAIIANLDSNPVVRDEFIGERRVTSLKNGEVFTYNKYGTNLSNFTFHTDVDSVNFFATGDNNSPKPYVILRRTNGEFVVIDVDNKTEDTVLSDSDLIKTIYVDSNTYNDRRPVFTNEHETKFWSYPMTAPINVTSGIKKVMGIDNELLVIANDGTVIKIDNKNNLVDTSKIADVKDALLSHFKGGVIYIKNSGAPELVYNNPAQSAFNRDTPALDIITKLDGADVVKVVGNTYNGAILTNTGSVYGWYDKSSRHYKVTTPSGKTYKDIIASHKSTTLAAISNDGEVFAWNNKDGDFKYDNMNTPFTNKSKGEPQIRATADNLFAEWSDGSLSQIIKAYESDYYEINRPAFSFSATK